MALQPSIEVLPVFGGIDTKTDPKFVARTNTIASQNTQFSGVQNVQKRYGQSQYSRNIIGGGLIQNGTAIGMFLNEILMFDGQVMYDVGTPLGLGKNTFRVGREYQYWRNKFGNPDNVIGSFAKTPMLRAEYHF